MTYRERFDDVVMSGKYLGKMAKLKRLAQLNYTGNKDEALGMAMEDLEDMTGSWFDPTIEQSEEIKNSIF